MLFSPLGRPPTRHSHSNKEALFKKAVGRYVERQLFAKEALEKSSVREVAEALLRGTFEFLADGYLATVQTGLAIPAANGAGRKELGAVLELALQALPP